MLGAIAGDIIGSVHESRCQKTEDFPLFVEQSRFTDDTVLTVAVADCLLTRSSYVDKFHEYTRAYPDRGYGLGFWRWVASGSTASHTTVGVMGQRCASAQWHSHSRLLRRFFKKRKRMRRGDPQSSGRRSRSASGSGGRISGSARRGKEIIRNKIEARFHYDLSRSIADIRPGYSFNDSCQGTVPEAITAFLESENYEDAVRLAVSLGGDADTLATITGGMAAAF